VGWKWERCQKCNKVCPEWNYGGREKGMRGREGLEVLRKGSGVAGACWK